MSEQRDGRTASDEAAGEQQPTDVQEIGSGDTADLVEDELGPIATATHGGVEEHREAAGDTDHSVEQTGEPAPADHAGSESIEASIASGDATERSTTEEQPRLATSELKAIIEALIFASPEPMTPKQLYKLLDTEPKEDIQAALAELKADYERPGGLQLVEVAGGFQIVTRPDLHEWVRRLFHDRTTQKLSVQALETLAVIAYRQPVTAFEITDIRGVNTSGVLNTLLERHLIKIVGRKQVVGRPFMYGTTKEFLIRFGLNDLSDLPKVQDMAEALGFETPAGLVEQNPPEEMLPLDEPDEELTVEDEIPEIAEIDEEDRQKF